MRHCFALLLLAALPSVVLSGDAGVEFFERKIRPVLVEHCYGCHSAEAKKAKGGLLLDSRDGLRKGGETGPGLVPGEPAKGLLLKAVHYTHESLKMPPKGKLPAAVITDLEAWVKMGAPDPRDKATAVAKATPWDDAVKQRSRWWSLRPLRESAVPKGVDAIDHFLREKRAAKQLTLAEPADPRTLLRRLNLVLIGLPPTPDEIDAFVKEWNVARRPAIEKAVDRLFASPHFGERWARHWMDVVRFSETHGNEWNYEVHHAWRYRDYLIRAFNDDVPFDQLLREHVAGDLLLKPRWNAKERLNESVIGTAFYRFGEVNHDDCIALRSIGYDIADNQIDTLTKAFQGLTVACARCHDHKIDAVSTRDYHGLLGVVRSTRSVSHTLDAPEVNAEVMSKMREVKSAIRREQAELWRGLLDSATLLKSLAASKDDKAPADGPLGLWKQLASSKQPTDIEWKAAQARIEKEVAEQTRFNREQFTTLADFRKGAWPDWSVDGQGLRGVPSRSGDFTVASTGERAVATILPAGAFTHALSEKLNGTLRSPTLTTQGKHAKFISFHVAGEQTSAVRLVANNCQLNYRNYRALTSPKLQWVTFPLPEETDQIRIYAELMTKFDNPKFPDQLGTLGGDNRNDRVAWEKAAADPRSYFGVTHVVLHDQPSPPKSVPTALLDLFTQPAPATHAEVAERFARRLEAAIQKWGDDKASDDDVAWLNAMLQSGTLPGKRSAKLDALVAEYRKLDTALSLPRVAPGMADGVGFSQPVLIRGDCYRPGEPTPRSYVKVLAPAPFKSPGSGRLELAELLASPSNPLTARVFVNRVWHHLFGAGLVRTVDDLGHLGDLPSHPELLDHLAAQFMKEGWSMKRLMRSLVLSDTFQSGHQPSTASVEIDPENRLLQHYPARRMEAEAIRDSLLTASGRLDRTVFGMSVPGWREKDDPYHRLFQGPLDGNGRRSLYIKTTLMEAPKFLDAFNLPGGKVCQGRRDLTSVPAQALAMLNDPFVLQQAETWGKRLVQRTNDTVTTRLDEMFRVALGREPKSNERERFTRFVAQLAELHAVAERDVQASPAIWRDVAHTLFNLSEFITIP
jgi:hypothetical protein